MRRKTMLPLYMAVFFGLLALLWLLLVCSAAIPNSALKANMEQSAYSYREKEAFSFENGRKWNGIADNYADTILLNVSWNMGKRGDPVLGSLDTWYYDGEMLGESVGLYLTVTEETVKPNVDYSRYWHGTAMAVRFFHLFTDVEGMKAAGAGAVLFLSLVTGAILVRHGHPELAAALALSMAAVRLWNVRLSLEYEPAFVICFLLCPVYLWTERNHPRYLTCVSVAGGVTTAFFDFLTTETVTVLFPLILVTAVREAEDRLGGFWENVRLLVSWGAGWLWGYGGAFLAKWAAASLVTGENKFLTAFSSAGERVAGSLPGETGQSVLTRIPMAVAANLTVLFGGEARVEPFRVAAGLLLSSMCLGSAVYLFYKRRDSTTVLKLFGILGGGVFVRYMVLSNHSYLHEFFTYRALISPVMAAMSGIVLWTEIPPKPGQTRRRTRDHR